jgi:predicted DNA-binding antitoxin AbrB/MazE fold protein
LGDNLMAQIITAIYENGVLRPLAPLNLPEQTTLQIQIRPPLKRKVTPHRQKVRAALVKAGLSLPPINSVTPSPMTHEQRAALAQKLAMSGRPLSEIIIEEREGR